MAEDDDRPGDASSAADASWADVVVPDDISSLVADVEAYRRELRRERRRAWQARVMSRPGILPLSIVSIALLLAGIVATLLTVLAPSSNFPTPVALARPTAAVGQPGGLLPAVSLRSDGQPTESTSLRPGVIAVVPAGCNCTGLLNTLAGHADGVEYPLDVVAASPTDATTLQSTVTAGRARVYEDPAASTTPAASLAGKLDASGLTLILVQPNGLIYEVDSNVTAVPGDMDAQLQTLLHSQGR